MGDNFPDSFDTPGLSPVSLQAQLEELQKQCTLYREKLDEQKANNESLKEEEERLRFAFEATRDGIWDINLDTWTSTFSPPCYTMLGYDYLEFPSILEAWSAITHPQDLDKARELFTSQLTLNNPCFAEVRMRHKSGEWFWILARGIVVQKDDKDNPVRLVGTFTNINDRKTMEKAISEKETRMEEAQRLAHAGSWSWNVAQDGVTWSDELYRIVGLAPGSPVPNRAQHQDLLTPGSWIDHENAIQQTLETGEPFEIELELVRPDGTHRWVVNRGAAEKDETGNVTRIFGSLQDVTEQKEVLEELKKNQKELQLVIEATAHGVFKVNLQTHELTLSPNYYIIHGYEVGEYPPDVDYITRHIIHPDDAQKVKSTLEDCQQGKSSTYDVEYRLKAKNGDYHWVHSIGKVVEKDKSGKPLRMIGNHINIVERKKAEEQVRASLREKETLLKEIHHRVKNNLQAVSSLLSLQVTKYNDPHIRKPFLQMKNRLRAMALVHEKLYQSHDFASIHFGHHIKAIADELSTAFGNEDIDVLVNAEDIQIDLEKAVPLSLILSELISNALIHAFPGRSAGTIEINLSRGDNNKAVLAIRDNGKGFPDDFDPGQSSTLGMTLITALVQQIDGSIEMSRDSGSAFTITFDVSSQTAD